MQKRKRRFRIKLDPYATKNKPRLSKAYRSAAKTTDLLQALDKHLLGVDPKLMLDLNKAEDMSKDIELTISSVMSSMGYR